MPIEIRMPALSPTMTEGNLARWLKKEGDAVHSGDVIAEIETDKATMEYEAADEGRLGKIIVPEGAQGIKVNQPIALLLEEGEDPAELEKFTASPQPAGAAPRTEPRDGPPVPSEPKTDTTLGWSRSTTASGHDSIPIDAAPSSEPNSSSASSEMTPRFPVCRRAIPSSSRSSSSGSMRTFESEPMHMPISR